MLNHEHIDTIHSGSICLKTNNTIQVINGAGHERGQCDDGNTSERSGLVTDNRYL